MSSRTSPSDRAEESRYRKALALCVCIALACLTILGALLWAVLSC